MRAAMTVQAGELSSLREQERGGRTRAPELARRTADDMRLASTASAPFAGPGKGLGIAPISSPTDRTGERTWLGGSSVRGSKAISHSREAIAAGKGALDGALVTSLPALPLMSEDLRAMVSKALDGSIR